MPKVVVESELYKRIEDAASKYEASTDEMFAEAVRRYLWELERDKISKESAIYRQRHAELKHRYLGQYIAMHNGQIVDHDTEFQALLNRIRKRYGRTPVMITRVEEEARQTFVRHGFSLEMAG